MTNEWIVTEEEDGWYVTAKGDGNATGIYLWCESEEDAEKLAEMLTSMSVTVGVA